MNLVKINDFLWQIPRQGAMLVPGRLYVSASMLEDLRDDPALIQVANVACLPGIVGYSLAMPDVHWGYGFPIGGVAAIDARTGVISPGGVGYDINCGVRLARTNLRYEEVAPKVDRLADALFNAIPAGVGSEEAIPSLSMEELRHLVRVGAEWTLRHGYATQEDLDQTEEGGRMPMAQPEKVSEHAYQRGRTQLGTLGSGNHFLEVSRVDQIYQPRVAEALGARTWAGYPPDSFRLPRARPSDPRRLPEDNRLCDGKVRDCPSRPPACGRADRLSRGTGLPGRNGSGGQLRMVQPPGHDAPGDERLHGGARD
jgi:tRNA-splicing ligase RtcB